MNVLFMRFRCWTGKQCQFFPGGSSHIFEQVTQCKCLEWENFVPFMAGGRCGGVSVLHG